MAEDGDYSMIRNIGFLFFGIEQLLAKGTVEEISKSWDESKEKKNKVIKSINKALDIYDEIFPYTWSKTKLAKEDLRSVHRLMEKNLYTTRYPIVNEIGADLEHETYYSGWLDLKKVILRFFSKVRVEIGKELEGCEEVEGTGLIRPVCRKDGSSLKGTGVFLVKCSESGEKAEEAVDNEKDKKVKRKVKTQRNKIKKK